MMGVGLRYTTSYDCYYYYYLVTRVLSFCPPVTRYYVCVQKRRASWVGLDLDGYSMVPPLLMCICDRFLSSAL